MTRLKKNEFIILINMVKFVSLHSNQPAIEKGYIAKLTNFANMID